MSNQEPKKKSFITVLIGTIARLTFVCLFLLLTIAMILTVGTGLWLKTYKAFTQEKLVAVIDVDEKKEDDDGNPYFKITYTPVDNQSALTQFILGEDENKDEEQIDEREEYYIYGDRFMVEAEVVNFSNWADFLGFKTIYKVTRIRGEYNDIEDEKNETRSIYDINGGMDSIWETLEYNQESLKPLVDSVYGSSASQSARRSKASWGIYMTEDGLIMKKYD